MSAWEDFTNGYQQVTSALNQQLGDYYDDYQTWAKKNKEMLPEAINKFADYVTNAAQTPGAEYLMPGMPVGMLAKNYRTAEQLQALRRKMAEEGRARGGLEQVERNLPYKDYWQEVGPAQTPVPAQSSPEWMFNLADKIESVGPKVEVVPNPFSQILRGSWYHGLSEKAREAVGAEGSTISPQAWNNIMSKPGELGDLAINNRVALPFANEMGFPISLHDSASISNKLGEPAGVSLSALPTKSQQFSADDYIHRVMPLYGGPPLQRTVNLMTPEGRAALNDAYDVVVNRNFDPSKQAKLYNLYNRNWDQDFFRQLQAGYEIGPFNKALSDQLQSQGYRGILYNPQRFNEYEMLMLDPKYALPLDYRKAGEYMILGMPRLAGYKETSPSISRIMEMTATPGVQRGLDQIRDVMEPNHSRLGDIYAERPWTQRLSEENKRRLLDLIDPNYREMVGNQLYSSKPYEIQPSMSAEMVDDWFSGIDIPGFNTKQNDLIAFLSIK